MSIGRSIVIIIYWSMGDILEYLAYYVRYDYEEYILREYIQLSISAGRIVVLHTTD